jgi:hypothetical protein
MNTESTFSAIFFAFVLFFSSSAYSQSTTIVLQPGPSQGYDVTYGNDPNYLATSALSTEFGAAQWTCGGAPCELRSLIKFNLSAIPTNAVVSSAMLSLSANPAQLNGNPAAGPTYGTENQSTLYPVTTNWDFNTVSWNNQPLLASTNATVIPQSITAYDDYNALDVTAAVQSMVNNPSSNFGWMLKINTQNFYNSMIFCSSNYPDSTKRPKLTITYVLSNCQSLKPGPLNGIDISYGSNPNYLIPDSMSTDLGASQWTCGGAPCESRALIKFDLSSFAQNAVLQSATLSLFANPAQLTGNPAAGPTHGTNNTSELLKIISPWSLSTVNWNNQPNVSNSDIVTLPQSVTSYDDYLNIDVTTIAQDWINNPGNNYGWMLKTQTSNYYNSMIFGSSNFPDTAKRPVLTLCFESTLSINSTDHSDDMIMLFPNPAQTDLNLSLNSSYAGKLTIKIINVMGQVIDIENVEKKATSFNLNFNVSSYSKGLYFIQVISPDKISTKRFYVN